MEQEAYMKDGIIIKPEKRSTIDKIKIWYYKKFIETGKAAKFEEGIEKRTKLEKTSIKIIGTAATIALFFCPADGPFGEICTALATPALCAFVNVVADLEKKILIKLKRKAENTMGFGKEGQSPTIEEPKLTAEDFINGAKVISQSELFKTQENFNEKNINHGFSK